MLPGASIANTTNDRAPDNCLGKDSSLELMYLVGQEETQSQKRGDVFGVQRPGKPVTDTV